MQDGIMLSRTTFLEAYVCYPYMCVFVCEPSILETGDSDFVSDLGLGFGRLRIASLGEDCRHIDWNYRISIMYDFLDY